MLRWWEGSKGLELVGRASHKRGCNDPRTRACQAGTGWYVVAVEWAGESSQGKALCRKGSSVRVGQWVDLLDFKDAHSVGEQAAGDRLWKSHSYVQSMTWRKASQMVAAGVLKEGPRSGVDWKCYLCDFPWSCWGVAGAQARPETLTLSRTKCECSGFEWRLRNSLYLHHFGDIHGKTSMTFWGSR